MYNYDDLGSIMRYWRENHLHISQLELAERLDCDVHSPSNWETGKYFPSVKYFCKFLILCGIYDIRDFFSVNFEN